MLKEDQKKSVNKHKGGKPTTKMDLFLGKAWLFHICVYTPGVRLPPPCWSCVSHWQGARLTRWLKGCLERTGSTLRGVFDPPLSMWQHDSGRNRYWNLFFLLRMLRQKLLDLNGTSIRSKWFVHCTNDINLMIRMQFLRQGNGLWEAFNLRSKMMCVCLRVCVWVRVCFERYFSMCLYVYIYM
jgi:hypothetical protein